MVSRCTSALIRSAKYTVDSFVNLYLGKEKQTIHVIHSHIIADLMQAPCSAIGPTGLS